MDNNKIVFADSKSYTLGVELEFQLVDQETLNMVPRVQPILDELAPRGSDRIVPEFLQSIIELQTGVCNCVADVAGDLGRTIQIVEDAADSQHCYLYSSSLHPFAISEEQSISSGDRYQRIMEELQLVGRKFISQGLHVHIGVSGGDEAIRVCAVLQAYLPILLAMSSSSPYYEGEDTGFQSYRTKLFEALPLAGIADYPMDWQGFVEEVDFLRERNIIGKVKDLWWDVRPSPGFGTVEIRACDIPSRFSEILGLTAVIQALVAFVAENRIPWRRLNQQLLRYNKWQSARHGLNGMFHDPYGLLRSHSQSMSQAAEQLFVLIQPLTNRFHTMDHIDDMRKVLAEGTSSDRQRALAGQGSTPRFKEMISRLRDDYWM